ncbi:MAG: hypothetical protein A2Y07_04790 [Planctomycetes bacterium GWF2_50_10]|nr:MAG: hypothetical protein A2Y07_04790 [Planctomycetes bacterium GWF2_50_10]
MTENLKNLPRLRNSHNYIGLYVVDFGDHAGVGFTGQEVTELLESEQYKDIKVYKIHNAYPDGKVELRGVRSQLFELEMGMFFYSHDIETAKADYKRLVNLAVINSAPTKAKVHLAKYSDEKFVVAIIFPAEYNDELSSWLIESGYKTQGEATGGITAVGQYYNDKPEVLEMHQLLGSDKFESRCGDELYKYVGLAVQR